MKEPPHNSDSDIGAFLHDLEEQNITDAAATSVRPFAPASPPKVVATPAADILILSEFLKRKSKKRHMSKRAIAIAAYETQRVLASSHIDVKPKFR